MKTIICATDFSANSIYAIHYAAALADKLESKIILVHAYEVPVLNTEQPLASISFEDEQLKSAAENKLRSIITGVKKKYPSVEVTPLLLEGPADLRLLEITREQKADLLVVGLTETTVLERLFTGSTTSTVLGEANCPVLCIPPKAKFRGINKIIFSTDLHEDNLRAATSLVPFSKKFDAEIIFLYVDKKHLIHSDEAISEMTAKIRSKIKYQKISGYISKNPQITEGISFFLKKHKADLLVMLTHQKHFPETLFNPSMTRVMSHETKIPLLSIKFSDIPVLKTV